MKWLLFVFSCLTSMLNADLEFTHRTDAYATHQPVLYEISKLTTGTIIEFGCGNGSTDILHEICKENQRLLISLDDNLEWLNKFSAKYSNDSEWHKFVFVPGKNLNDPDNPQHWIDFLNTFELLKSGIDICFVDQHPWLARLETIQYMKDKANYVILHDCDYFPMNGVCGTVIQPSAIGSPGIFDFGDIFQHFKVYFPLGAWPGPPTLVGSEFKSDFPQVDFNAY